MASLRLALSTTHEPRPAPQVVMRVWSNLQALELVKRARHIPGFVDESTVVPPLTERVRVAPTTATPPLFNASAGQQRGWPADDRQYTLPEIPALPDGVVPPTIGVRLPRGEVVSRWTDAGFLVWGSGTGSPDLTLALQGEAEADFNAGAQQPPDRRYAALGTLAPLVATDIAILREQTGPMAAVEVTRDTDAGEEMLVLPPQTPLLEYFPFVREALSGPTLRLTVFGDEVIHASGGATPQEADKPKIPAAAAGLAREALRRLGWDAALVEVVHNKRDGRWYVRDVDSGFRNATPQALRTLGRALQRAAWMLLDTET